MKILLALVVLASSARGRTLVIHRQSTVGNAADNPQTTEKLYPNPTTEPMSGIINHQVSSSMLERTIREVFGSSSEFRQTLHRSSAPLDTTDLRSLGKNASETNVSRPMPSSRASSVSSSKSDGGSIQLSLEKSDTMPLSEDDDHRRLSETIASLFAPDIGSKEPLHQVPKSSDVLETIPPIQNSTDITPVPQVHPTDGERRSMSQLNDILLNMRQPKFFVLRRTQRYFAQEPDIRHHWPSPLSVPQSIGHFSNSSTAHQFRPLVNQRRGKRGGSLSSTFLSPKFFLRPRKLGQSSKRSHRKPVFEIVSGLHKRKRYDVPQVECPPTQEGIERFACPSPDRMGRYKCMLDHAMCDGFIDCPNAEDEDRTSCMFYHTTKTHLDVLADALLRWARGRY